MVHAALSAIRDAGGSLPVQDVLSEVRKRTDLDDYAMQVYEKTGYVRWESLLHFFSIDCVKAGYMRKKKGVWYITPEGVEALKLGPTQLMEKAAIAYRKWKAGRKPEPGTDVPETEIDEESSTDYRTVLDQAEQRADEAIKKFIASKNAYEFQDLVAALLRGMGYYTPFIAPKGKDGGVDIFAYRDPFGIESPRIKVQVKHREQSATVQEIRQLIGVLHGDGDVGLFVSTGGFTSDAKAAAVSGRSHVELVDLDAFVNLWQEFYKKLPDEDKSLMPLVPVYFVGPVE